MPYNHKQNVLNMSLNKTFHSHCSLEPYCIHHFFCSLFLVLILKIIIINDVSEMIKFFCLLDHYLQQVLQLTHARARPVTVV